MGFERRPQAGGSMPVGTAWRPVYGDSAAADKRPRGRSGGPPRGRTAASACVAGRPRWYHRTVIRPASPPPVDDSAAPPPPRPAASLVLLRDAPGGLQVLMLERPGDDAVLAGAHVFPGGKLERDDADAEALERLPDPPRALHARLGEADLPADTAAALFFAAVREAFEETGVLLATGADEATAERARVLAREGRSFVEVLEALGLTLDTGLMQPWSRWVTPRTPTLIRRRFDTRFFVARLPAGQQARHDPREAVAADWFEPRAALERYWAKGIDLAAPQIMTGASNNCAKMVSGPSGPKLPR